MSSGFAFDVHSTRESALAFLARWPVAFMDSQWLEAHLHLLRAAGPAIVLALFDHVAARVQAELAPSFPSDGAPMRSSLTGVPFGGPHDAASFVRRRRELLVNALASPTLGIREQMVSFEMDIHKTR